MNRLVLVVFVVLVSSGPAYGQNPEEVFQSANRMYQEGNFRGAHESYEVVIRNGYESSVLYYNLGNAFFRLGDVPRAILNYERGFRLAPTDDDLQYNLELSRMLTVDKIGRTPRLFFWDYWDDIKGSFSPEGIVWIAYASYLIMLVALAILLIGRTVVARRMAFFSLAGMGIVFALALVVAVARFSDLNRRDTAIVTSEVVTAKNSPDKESTDAFVLHGGTKVLIVDQVGEWMMIRLEDGKVGWMETNAAEVI